MLERPVEEGRARVPGQAGLHEHGHAEIPGSAPTSADVVSILDDLLEERAALTMRLLGQPPGGDGPPTPPPEAMGRAFAATGLPMPPP